MSSAHLTDAQREAVETTDCSLLVSAAAGSGKTMVLAERCARLVCDAPPGELCSVDELLVVTFTEAAAAEMRARIANAIRKRLADNPRDQRLRQQLHLLDSASISTIHAFCKNLVQRWFPQAGIDPQAAVLSEEEAELLRREVLGDLCEALYGSQDESGLEFQRLIDEYGDGDDTAIGEVILNLHSFISSLPDPETWLDEAVRRVNPDGPGGISSDLHRFQHERLNRELELQIECFRHGAETIRRCWPVAAMHAEAMDEHAERLEDWRNQLATGPPQKWEAVAEDICEFDFGRARSRPRNLSDEDKAAYDAAKALRDKAKERFTKRLADGICRFTAREHREGLACIAPFVQTLVLLVRNFDVRYTAAKSEQAVMDFNDLQRLAFRLLAEGGDPPARPHRRDAGATLVAYQRDAGATSASDRRDAGATSIPHRRDAGATPATPATHRREADATSGAAPAAVRPSEVARQLQRQYRHVLVDEFQDVDPLQEAILRLVSRESAHPPAGNLFAVGDIKQSIYRFRLAEPALFTARADAFSNAARGTAFQAVKHGQDARATGESIGRLIHLQQNFRSRAGIIEAINLIFRPLMSRAFGGTDYDETAQLHAGATYPESGDTAAFDHPAVELHLLEPITQHTRRDADGAAAGNGEDEGSRAATAAETATADQELEGLEREAFLIARRIADWMGDSPEGKRRHVADKPAEPGGPPALRPMSYRDVVILLRSTHHKAEPIADVLRRMGIPARIDRSEHRLDSIEFRDVYSLLQLLDNRQQDLPLAAVLRSPLLGEPFTASDLVRIRLLDRETPFYAAARRYALSGDDADLRKRLANVMAAVERYRLRVQRAPVAEVLWQILEESGYLHFVSGLPDGQRRREHLLHLHDLARAFGRFARQGLRRFLRFLEEMLAREASPRRAGGGAADEDVVRIMTIHASKGLEFPVVILADLQKQFNRGDSTGSVLIDRQLGIGMQAVDAERQVRYPTLIHSLAAESIRRENLSEELRVLYVALTRAREHLVLVGRMSPERVAMYQTLQPVEHSPAAHPGSGRPPWRPTLPRLALETANNPLDWLLPAIAAAPPSAVQWPGSHASSSRGQDAAFFRVHVYDRAETDQWSVPPAVRPERAGALALLAELQPLPAGEPLAPRERTEPILAPLETSYAAAELTTLPARVSVSELKRRYDSTVDPDERPQQGRKPKPYRRAQAPRPAFLSDSPAVSAADRGNATHLFLQLVDLTRPCDAADLQRQRDELLSAGRLSPRDAGAVMLEAAAWFFTTDLGQRMRSRSADVRRELTFVSRIAPEAYDPMVHGHDERDVLLVRGMIDVLIAGPDGLDIIDYKTDSISAADCPTRAADYQLQLDHYAAAIQAACRRPVREKWLVFLHPRQMLQMSSG